MLKLLFTYDNSLIDRVQCTRPSVLYMACAFGVIEVANFLFEHGMNISDLYRIDANGLSFWSNLITIISSRSMVSTKKSERDISNRHILNLIHQVSWSETEKNLSMLMERGLDINHKDKSGSFALSIACREGHTELVKFLLSTRKVNVNEKDRHDVSSLMQACNRGHAQILHLLLRYHAWVDLRDARGCSALMFAVAGGHTELVIKLLDEGADVNCQNVQGTSPLMLSCYTGNEAATNVLLAQGANVNFQNRDGHTALMMSCSKGHMKIIDELLRHSADMTMKSKDGMTALDYSENEEVSTLLRKFGATPRLGKRPASTAIVILHNINELHSMQIEQTLEDALKAFTAPPTIDDKLRYFPDNAVPMLGDACDLFREFAYNWKIIGTQLGISASKLKEIESDCMNKCKSCFEKMLEIWLQRTSHPSWADLRKAVEEATSGTLEVPGKVIKN